MTSQWLCAGHGWPCLSLPTGLAPLGSPFPYGCGCLEMHLTLLDG